MLAQIITENGQKKIVPLTADAGAGLPVGFIAPAYKKGNYSGWLYLDGRDTTGTSEELSTHYPLLYALLGSNVLPDYREFALVGAEENTTDVYNASTNPNGTIHDHDVYTEGQAKDDQFQTHWHRRLGGTGGNATYVGSEANTNRVSGAEPIAGDPIKDLFNNTSDPRYGSVTRGKRKAVYFYIKATSGLTEGQQDDVANLINSERSYSTEEINTGKKWIDGKPIYRRVVPYTVTSAMGANVIRIADTSTWNIDMVTGINIISKSSSGSQSTQYYIGATDNMRALRSSDGNISVQLGSSAPSRPVEVWVTVEYTKTT